MRPLTGTSLWLPAIAAGVALSASLLVACSATPAGSSQSAATSPSLGSASPTVVITPEPSTPTVAPTTPAPTAPPPSGPVAIRPGFVGAGTYTTTSFKPTILLTLPTDGWQFFFKDDDDEMALGRGAVELTGGRVANVLEPMTHAVVPAPDDLVSWLASHPRLKAGTPQPATVGGIVGQSIDLKNTGTSNIDIFAYPTGNLRLAGETTARLWVLPQEGPDLVFTGFAPTSLFPGALPVLQPVIDSIVVAPG